MGNFLGDGLGSVLGAFPLVNGLFGGDQEAEEIDGPNIPELKTSAATEGVAMPIYLGSLVPVPGTLIYVSPIDKDKVKVSLGSGKSAGKATAYEFFVDVAVSFGQAIDGDNSGDFPNSGKIHLYRQVHAESKLIYDFQDEDKADNRYDELTLKLGGNNQNPLDFIEDEKGTGKVPGFRNTVVLGVKGLALKDWGLGRIPNAWKAILRADPQNYLISEGLAAIWRYARGDVSEIDVSSVTGTNLVRAGDAPSVVDGELIGAVWLGLQDPRQMLDQLMFAYYLGVTEDDGKLIFYDRGSEPVHRVPIGDFVATESDRTPGSEHPIRFNRRTLTRLVTDVTIQFYNKKSKFRRSSVRQRRNVHALGATATGREQPLSIDLPIVLFKNQANRVARKRLFGPLRERMEASFSLLPHWLHIREGDIVTPVSGPYDDTAPTVKGIDGNRFYLRIIEKLVGANGLVRLRAVVQEVASALDPIKDPSTLGGAIDDDDTVDGDPEDDPDITDPDEEHKGAYEPPQVEAVVAQLPPIFDDSEAIHAMAFVAVCARDSTAPWIGATLWKAAASGGPYKAVDYTLGGESVMGRAITTLPAPPPGVAGFLPDLVSTVRVQMFHGTLTTTTFDGLLANENQAFVGSGTAGEVIAFLTATPIADLALSGFEVTCNSANQITRNDFGGDWAADGVVAGMFLKMAGWTTKGNSFYVRQVLEVTGAVLLVEGVGDDPAIPDLVAEANVDGVSFTVSGVYELSTLFRGLRDTIDHSGDHDGLDMAKNPFLPLVPGNLTALEFKTKNIAQSRWFKAVTEGQSVAAAQAVEVVVAGESMRCFRPGGLAIVREADDDIRVSWQYRDRRPEDNTPPDPTNVLDPSPYRYRLNFYAFQDLAKPLRQVDVTIDPADPQDVASHVYTYTLAQQSSDASAHPSYGWTAGNSETTCVIQQRGNNAGVKPGNTSSITLAGG